jgi:hypothetical protein
VIWGLVFGRDQRFFLGVARPVLGGGTFVMDRVDLLLPRHHSVKVDSGASEKGLLIIIIRLSLASTSRFTDRYGGLGRGLVLLSGCRRLSFDEFVSYLSNLLLVLIF